MARKVVMLLIVLICSLISSVGGAGSNQLHIIDNPHISSVGVSERRRILVAPSELEEQRGCAVLAFREWIAPLAIKTSRALIVPNRFATLFNFTSVGDAWKTNCGMKDVVHDQQLFNKRYGHLCASNSSTFRLRIEKEWSGASGAGLAECSKKYSGIDKCVVLKGQASLFDLLKIVPQLMDHIPCVIITHGARGFKTTKTNLCQNDKWNSFDFTQKYHTLAYSFASKQHPALHIGGSDQNYVSAHFRTEKWASTASTSPACWAQIGLGLTAALKKFNCKTVFLGTDVGHSFSYGHQKQQQIVAKLMQEQVVVPLQSLGYKVILGSDCKASGSDTSVECATVDQILMASAKVFVHMYHQAPSACDGASSGSCYGQWILRNRSWKKLPSFAIAKLVAQEEEGHVNTGLTETYNSKDVYVFKS